MELYGERVDHVVNSAGPPDMVRTEGPLFVGGDGDVVNPKPIPNGGPLKNAPLPAPAFEPIGVPDTHHGISRPSVDLLAVKSETVRLDLGVVAVENNQRRAHLVSGGDGGCLKASTPFNEALGVATKCPVVIYGIGPVAITHELPVEPVDAVHVPEDHLLDVLLIDEILKRRRSRLATFVVHAFPIYIVRADPCTV